MNFTDLEKTLISAARAHPPSDHVPYAFAQRVIALLRARRPLDAWSVWAGGLWRAALASVALVLVLTALSILNLNSTRPTKDLSQDFERSILAAVDHDSDYSW